MANQRLRTKVPKLCNGAPQYNYEIFYVQFGMQIPLQCRIQPNQTGSGMRVREQESQLLNLSEIQLDSEYTQHPY